MDPIAQRLAALERETQHAQTGPQRLLASGLLLPTLGFISGIWLQVQFALFSPAIWMILLATSVAAALFCYFRVATALALQGSATLALLTLGALRLIQFQTPAPLNIVRALTEQPRLATLRGTILTTPIHDHQAPGLACYRPLPPGMTFLLRCHAARGPDSWYTVHGTIRVRLGDIITNLQAGETIELSGWLDRIPPPTNPGQFDGASHWARQNIQVSVFAPTRHSVKHLPPQHINAPLRFHAQLQAWAQHALLKNLPTNASATHLISALVLGQRHDLDPATYRAFEQTGLLHFISLSGLHVGILLSIWWGLGHLLGLSKPQRASLCLLALGSYLLLVPARGPTLRAALIAALFCIGLWLRRRVHPLHSLALAALILLLLFRPTYLYEPGWQLSFACVLGILAWSRRLQTWLLQYLMALPWPTAPPAWQWLTQSLVWLGRGLVGLWCVGISAYAAGLGVLVYHFHTLTPWASVWTLLAFPLVALLLGLGMFKLLLTLVCPPLTAGVTPLLLLTAQGLEHLVTWEAQQPFSFITLGQISVTTLLVYYLLLLGIHLYLDHPQRRHRFLVIGLLLLILTTLTIRIKSKSTVTGLRLTCLDVGHGQAIVLQCDNITLICDAGSLQSSHVGRSVIVPFLRHSGIRRIHHLFLSHCDGDHISATPEILDYGSAPTVWLNTHFLQQLGISALGQLLKDCLTSHGLAPIHLPPSLEPAPGLHIDVLALGHPPEHLSDNNASSILLIHYAGQKILLCGDLEQPGQLALMEHYPNLQVDTLVLPHHGSRNTLDPNFVPHFQPTITLTSCGRSQLRQGRVARMSSSQGEFLTARDGAITLSIDPQGHVRVKTYLNIIPSPLLD